jgi:predicted amino acid-binding ACT domain protein
MLRLLSNKLSELGIDIRNLFAERCENDGTFAMELELAVPETLDIAHARDQVGTRCREVGLEAALEPAAEFFARCGRNLRDAVRAETR